MKIISDKQIRAVLAELDTRRYPLRDRVAFLLSVRAGMRAIEIASVTWSMVMDSEGEVGDVIALENRAAKGKHGGRIIPVHPYLKAALIALHRERAEKARPDLPVIYSERDRGLSPALPSPSGSTGSIPALGWSAARHAQVAEPSSLVRHGKSARLAAASEMSSNSPVMRASERPLDTSRAITTRSGKSLPRSDLGPVRSESQPTEPSSPSKCGLCS